MEIEIDQSPEAATVLQDYLAALAGILEQPESRRRTIELLRAYAELHFRLAGGGHCAVCGTHVRHVLPITAERFEGGTKEFECLCTRCFESERKASRTVLVRAGCSCVEFRSDEPTLEGEPHPENLRPERIIY